MRLFGRSAPAIGAGPMGQLDSLRVPARIAAAKLIASFFPRPATSLGEMLSELAGSETAASVEGAAADGVVVDAAGSTVDAGLASAGVALLSAGAGVEATSPPLT